jgi:tetratricopeptide (TPR) repeat protein
MSVALGQPLVPTVPLNDRLQMMQGELDRMFAYLQTYANAASALLAVLAILIGIALVVASYFMFSANRNSRVARALRDEVAEMGHRRTELQRIFEDKVAQLETRLTSYENELRQEIVARSGMMRDLVAGELCYRQSDYGGAVEHYGSVREREPTNEEASYYLGRALTNLNRIDDAVRLLEEQINANPNNARAQRGLALALRFRNPRRAREVAHAALRMPSVPSGVAHDLHNEYALLLRDNGQFEEGLEQHMAALALKPADTVTEYFVAVAEMLCNRIPRGRSRFLSVRERARIELEDRKIRPLWAGVILWSAAFASGEEEDAAAELIRIKGHLDSSYLEQTVAAHMQIVAKVVGKDAPPLT